MEWYYQIKGKDSCGNWQFPPLWSDKIEAETKDEARRKIEIEFGKNFKVRGKKGGLDSNDFFLSIKQVDGDSLLSALFDVKPCKNCGKNFKTIEKYQANVNGGGRDFCGFDCYMEYFHTSNLSEEKTADLIINGKYPPVIYKITNKITQKCYIGKTTQPFTLRWYQHFFQSKGTKFHEEIKKYQFSDWIFEVQEMIVPPKIGMDYSELSNFIMQREKYYISLYDSINNGYNSVGIKDITTNDKAA